MKRILALLFALAMVAAACGGDDAGDVTEGGEDTTDTADSGEDADATEDTADSGDESGDDSGAAGDAATIEMWIAFSDDARLGFTRDRAAEFNEAHPEYNVVVTEFDSYNTVFEQAQLAIEDGNPPEIIHFFEAATQEALDAVDGDGNPIFTSVTDAIGDRTEILGEPVVLGDVVSAATKYYTIDGQLYSMPWNTSSTTMFSNMDILNEAGITEPPATWAEVEAACEAIMALPDAPSEGCITWPNHGWFYEQSLGQMGADLVNNDNGRSARATEIFLDSPEAVDYIQWWSDLEDAGHFVYTGVQRDWDGTSAAFQAQNVAMLIYSSSDTTALTNAGVDNGFEVRSSFMPYNQDVAYEGNLIGGATLWLANGLSETEQDGALAFLNFFSNPENAAAWHQLTGYIPITNAAVALLEERGWYDESPNSAVASDQLDAAADTPAATGALVGNFVAIRDVVTAAIEDILVNNVDVAERMASAQADAQQQLDDYNELFGE
ncbi:MAG: extracellular solute-binding protein [Acidimicrobiia bacterium]|nr:extracellular solute-binding protein [Acidimicrobiia bacterium]